MASTISAVTTVRGIHGFAQGILGSPTYPECSISHALDDAPVGDVTSPSRKSNMEMCSADEHG